MNKNLGYSETKFLFAHSLRLYALFGFFLGFLGSYWVQDHYYFYFAYSTLCLGEIHWHHLYSGLILLFLLLIFYKLFLKYKPHWKISLIILISLSIGMILDDIFTHFIFKIDPFIFYCWERP